MTASALLALPAELRNAVLDYVIFDSIKPTQKYTFLDEALRRQPALANTCRQLRAELRPMYFSSLKLVLDMTDLGHNLLMAFLHGADDPLLAGLPQLSINIACGGWPRFCSRQAVCETHHALHDIRPMSDGTFEVIELHGFWHKESGIRIFKPMNREDSLGFATCTNFEAFPVEPPVVRWGTGPFTKEKIMRLIHRLGQHPLVPFEPQIPAEGRDGYGTHEASIAPRYRRLQPCFNRV